MQAQVRPLPRRGKESTSRRKLKERLEYAQGKIPQTCCGDESHILGFSRLLILIKIRPKLDTFPLYFLNSTSAGFLTLVTTNCYIYLQK